MTPRGGTGMNTATHDAYDLGWKLAWVLRGWAHDELLASYEVERRPAGLHNVDRAGDRSERPALAHTSSFSRAECVPAWVARGALDGRHIVLRPGDGLDPEAPRWRWPASPQTFRGSRRRGVGPAQGRDVA